MILYKDEDVELVMEIHNIEDKEFHILHTKVTNWSLSRYKKFIIIFADILNRLHEVGIDKVYAIPPSEKEEKWQSLFGFMDSGWRLGPYKVMELNCGS